MNAELVEIEYICKSHLNVWGNRQTSYKYKILDATSLNQSKPTFAKKLFYACNSIFVIDN